MKVLLSHCLVFFFIYSVRFFFLPVGSRVIYGLLGLLIFCNLIVSKSVTINRNYALYLFYLTLILIPTTITIIYNGNLDVEFYRYFISIVVINLSAYFVLVTLKRLDANPDIPLYIINVIFFQAIISVLMFIFPHLRDFLLTLQNLTPSDVEKLQMVEGFRIVGFGTYFFGAGVISGFGLILISYVLRSKTRLSVTTQFFLFFKYMTIFIVGLMMSRTTLIGLFLSLLIILFDFDFKVLISNYKRKFNFTALAVFVSILVIISTKFNFYSSSDIIPVIEFAFELFINYFNNGSLESASTNRLYEMYTLPSEIKTWLIGDSFWTDPNGVDYYMNTDVGYLRMIYYFGLLGCILYFLSQIKLIKITFKERYFSLVLVCYLFVLNAKGFTDLTPLILLFTLNEIMKRKPF